VKIPKIIALPAKMSIDSELPVFARINLEKMLLANVLGVIQIVFIVT